MTAFPTTRASGPAASATLSLKPLVLSAPLRGTDLHVRVIAPTTGTELPVVLFAHGFGSDLDGYAPLVDHWASGGFAVIQATHLDSQRMRLPADDPRRPHLWCHRVQDMRRILDELAALEAAVPGLSGRWTAAASWRPGTPSEVRPPAYWSVCASPIRRPALPKTFPTTGLWPVSSWPPRVRVVTN